MTSATSSFSFPSTTSSSHESLSSGSSFSSSSKPINNPVSEVSAMLKFEQKLHELCNKSIHSSTDERFVRAADIAAKMKSQQKSQQKKPHIKVNFIKASAGANDTTTSISRDS